MNNVLALMFAGVAGGLLGLMFFGGLRWTVDRAFESTRPALWIGSSLLLRMACAVAGFVVVSAGDWLRLLSCLAGFLTTRWLVIRLMAEPAGVSRATLGAGKDATR